MSSSRRGWHLIDFAVIATLEEEFDAVKRVFGLQDKDFRKEENFYYKEMHEIRVGFFKFTQRGNLQSASQTQEIIERFKPEYIILVGIAGGFRGNIRLGDVAVSEYLEYYEYKKVGNGGLKTRPITIAAPSKQLLDIVPRVGDRWKECVKTPRPDGKRVKETRVVSGFILSGETIQSGKLLIDEGILKKKPIAVETEAGGVGKAVWTTGGSQYLVVKGISDFADAPESQELREKWRSYASEVAAAFAYGLILTAIKTIYAGISEVRGDLKNYLKKIKNEFEEPNPIDHKRLKEYYVSARALTEIYEVDRNRIESYFEPLITSYFHRSTNGIGSQKIEFIHKSFQEYLLAEYYYECIKEGKAHWLNVGIPSEETMSFLKGLVQMLEYYSVQEVLKSIDGENAFIKTEDREKVFINSKNITEDESYILPATKTEIVEHKFWTKINISADHHPLMWMHRWIALSVLSWLHVGETIDVHKIERLIRLSSYYPIPSHVKNLERMNLSGADLAGANLRRANLTRANLVKAGLIGANLNRAVLKRANMRGADLTDAILRNADLSDADFTGATLCNADLRGAKTDRAIFRDADLSGVIGLKTTD